MTEVAMQATINEKVEFSGKALQTGEVVSAVCSPAAPGAGVIFKRVDLPGTPELPLRKAVLSDAHDRRTTVVVGPAAVQTVEHLLAALWAMSIDNMLIEVDGPELPAMDGSALEFFRAFKGAGTVGQELPRRIVNILEAERVEDSGRSIELQPAEDFSVSYLIDYPLEAIGREVFDIKIDRDSFEKEIAPARTFCMKEEADALLKAGLGKGATLENTLVMDAGGPIGTTLRFPNEPVRHKILDLVGDLYLLGHRINGRIVAEKSGHALNALMVRKIYEKYVN